MKYVLFILLPATAFLYYPFAFEEFETPKAYALVTFACFSFFFVRWKRLFYDGVAQALLLFTASAAVSTIYSIDWHVSLFGNPKCPMGLLVIASYLVLYLAAAQVVKRKKAAIQAIDIVLSCAAVIALYALAQAFGYDFKQWGGVLADHKYMRPISTLGHANFMANYLAMALPFALWRLDRSIGRLKLLFAALCGLFVAATFASLSRGMCIAEAASVLTYFIYSKQYKKIFHFAGATSVIVLLGLAFIPQFELSAEKRMESIITPGPARLEYPKGAIRIWKKSPWIGIGTDVFEYGFQNQRTPYYWEIEKGGSPHRAHNDFLNILATQGIYGAIAAILLTLAALFRIKNSVSVFAAPATAAIAAFYIAGLTSFVVVPTGVLFMISLALLRQE